MSNYLESIVWPIEKVKNYALIRIQSLHRLEQLRRGEVYFSSLEYLRTNNQKERQGVIDNFEGASAIFQASSVDVILGEKDSQKKIEGIKDQILVHKKEFCKNSFVLCMYGMHSNGAKEIKETEKEKFRDSLKLKDEMLSHGNHVCIFIDPIEFIRRIKNEARRLRFYMTNGSVEYYNSERINGHIPDNRVGFCKPHKFIYQQEYRILLRKDSCSDSSVTLNIGDISKITMLMPFEEFNEKFKIHFEAFRVQK